MNPSPLLAHLIQAFFQNFLVALKGLSSNTIVAYRDGLKLFLNFAARRQKKSVDQLTIEDFQDQLVIDFLDDLEAFRGNSTRTRNARLAALHSLFRYLAGQHPEAMACCQQICALPLKRTLHKTIEYLEDHEVRALLTSVDPCSRNAPRDYGLLLFLYNTGARAQEVVDLKIDQLRFQTPYQVKLMGKGRKERSCPLWPETVQALQNYIDHRKPSGKECRSVFLNTNGKPITRFGIRYIVRKKAAKAAEGCDSIKTKKVSPHTMRHTTGMHLLQAGNDISVIKDWLGHADLNTTHGYVEIDMKMKRKALEACEQPKIQSEAKNKPEWLKPGIIEWLEGLSVGATIMCSSGSTRTARKG